MIKVQNISKSFGSQQVLKDISLTIEQGSTVAVVGPSGTGKSVLLKIITGLLAPDQGEVLLNGRSLTKAKNGDEFREIQSLVGVLFQGAALFDSLTIFENVAFPLRTRFKFSEQEIARKVSARLDEVGMIDYAFSLPGEISIGMKKRVGIARALVSEPKIFLFDEPNTALDPQTGQEIYDLIKDYQERLKFTGIVISHEIPEVFQVCSRVIMLYDGRVQFDGEIEAFTSSKQPIVNQFVAGDPVGQIQIC
jgi:phospholipid/cholesterol/gamma-HCH transport system ATP-binding protein